jgi:TonB family protein
MPPLGNPVFSLKKSNAMKPFRSFLPLFCLLSLSLPAQTDSLPPFPEAKVIEMFDVTHPPAFPGGQNAMLQFLASNIIYPDSARLKNIQGTVAATFVIDRDGSVTDAVIIRDIGGGCGEEVLRVLSVMPNWAPGEVDGQPVKVRFTLPVRFRFEDEKPKKKG